MDPFDLVSVNAANKEDLLRRALYDARKEYSSLNDVLVEATQNALDALDEFYVRRVLHGLKLDPDVPGVMAHWADAVKAALKKDCEAFDNSLADHERSAWHVAARDEQKRRKGWYGDLANVYNLKITDIERAYRDAFNGWKPRLEIKYDASVRRIDIIDNGIGMTSIFDRMRRGFTTKSRNEKPDEHVRIGSRGIHGWGFLSLLARCEHVRVASLTEGGSPETLGFSNFLSFMSGTAMPTYTVPPLSHFALPAGHGTHLILEGIQTVQGGVFEDVFAEVSPERLGGILRSSTPVGQTNDFVAHPALHTLRRGELAVAVTDLTTRETTAIDYDYLRVSEFVTAKGTYDSFYSKPSDYAGGTVHVLHRYRSSIGDVYLSGAEFQEAQVLDRIEKDPAQSVMFLGKLGATDKMQRGFDQGISLAHGGGMRSEVVLLEPIGNRSMIRGITLCDTLSPTIGRKSVVADRRLAASRAAARIFSAYDESVRKRLKGAWTGGPTVKSFVERRLMIQKAIDDVGAEPPMTGDLNTWATEPCKECRVMLLFAELLSRGTFGDLRLLSVGLGTQYDFVFLYRSSLSNLTSQPSLHIADVRRKSYAGAVEMISGNKTYYQYGIGEHKAAGADALSDFELKGSARKDPNVVDLLVCWNFDEHALAEHGWESDPVTDSTRVFKNETHQWSSPERTIGFPISVIRLKDVIASEMTAGTLQDKKIALPKLYF